MTAKKLLAQVPTEYAGKRVDQALAALFPDFSRSRLQQWVREGYIRLGSKSPRSSDKVAGGEAIEIDVPEPPTLAWEAEAIPLALIYEDDHILVINKPPGMVVHPGPGNREHTLLNAILHHAPGQDSLARAGIVHRLDKDTSGLLVVAKTETVRLRLMNDLQKRRIKREYIALVQGVMIAGGDIEGGDERLRAVALVFELPALDLARPHRQAGGQLLQGLDAGQEDPALRLAVARVERDFGFHRASSPLRPIE